MEQRLLQNRQLLLHQLHLRHRECRLRVDQRQHDGAARRRCD
jgi:hypothetical protein